MDIEAFILIGGRSRRFGSDKSLAILGGKRVVDALAGEISTALPGSRITSVAGSNDQLISGAGLATRMPMIFDLAPGRGPVGGLHAALSYTMADWSLVLACDMPFISAGLIRLLVENCDRLSDAVVPIQPDGRPQPLCALYRRAGCVAALDELLNARRPAAPSMQFLLGNLNVEYIASDEIGRLERSERFFTNINTLDDLELASKLIVADAGQLV